MLRSELAREALDEGKPVLAAAVNVFRAVLGHEIDARIDMRPAFLEHKIEGELKQAIGEALDDVIKAIETCNS